MLTPAQREAAAIVYRRRYQEETQKDYAYIERVMREVRVDEDISHEARRARTRFHSEELEHHGRTVIVGRDGAREVYKASSEEGASS